MAFLIRASRAIDRVSVWVGRAVMWLILIAVLVSVGNATSRKFFDLSSNAWLELQWYLFGAAWLLAAAYTLQRDDHIRIDVLSGHLSARTRNWIDLAGHSVMLMPFCLLMIYELVPFAARSFRIGEMSSSAGGLPVWPAKIIILAGFFLLAVQAVSEIIKRIAVLRGDMPDPRLARGEPRLT